MDSKRARFPHLVEVFSDRATDVIELCRRAKTLEEVGDYEGARDLLSPLWRGAGHEPRREGLSILEEAELLMRAGSLTGWIGSARQLSGSQGRAKDLLSEAARLFREVGERDKELESMLELATCYWREGAFDEGRILVAEVIAGCGERDDLRALAVLRSGLIEISAGRLHAALHILASAKELFDRVGDPSLSGRYHNQLATALKDLGASERKPEYTDRALIEFAAASYFFEISGHERYRARVENNIGFLHAMAGRISEAHKHLDRARALFSSLKDKGSIAQVDETRARALIDEGRYGEAERVAREAATSLEDGDERALLAEALTTRGRALARLGRYDEALKTLKRAGVISSLAGDNEGAASASLTVCEELHGHVPRRELLVAYTEADARAGDCPSATTLSRLRAAARLLFGLDGGSRRLTTPVLVNASPAVLELLSLARLVAPSVSPVLITGEPGTGRRSLAELIHEWGGRPGAFVALDCSNLPTDWHQSRDAASGTLYLDGAGLLGLEEQKRLLGLVDLTRVSSPPFRVILSSDRDLSESVANGDFCASLYYRLSGVSLEVPPLRERPEDVETLLRLFVAEAAREFGAEAELTPEAVEAVRRLPLFGNVPELRALAERLALARPGREVRAADVARAAAQVRVKPQSPSPAWHPCDLQAEMLRLERYHIENALRAAGGRVSHAAPLLGLRHIETLAAKIRARHPDLMSARLPVHPRRSSRRRKRFKVVAGKKD
jgi:tetratricopeptide (TPR) repeat protein